MLHIALFFRFLGWFIKSFVDLKINMDQGFNTCFCGLKHNFTLMISMDEFWFHKFVLSFKAKDYFIILWYTIVFPRLLRFWWVAFCMKKWEHFWYIWFFLFHTWMTKVMNSLNHFGYSGVIILSACNNGFCIKECK